VNTIVNEKLSQAICEKPVRFALVIGGGLCCMDAFCSEITAMSGTLTCLGTGDGHPSAKRNHSAFLYRIGDATLLIDCGEPVTRQLLASGMELDDIDRVFLSHMHSDHVGGFFMFIQGCWLRNRQRNLQVHLPVEGEVPIQQMLKAAYIFPELLAFEMEWSNWQECKPVIWNGLTATPYHTTHLEQLREAFQPSHPSQSFEAFAFVLEGYGVRVGHSADIGAINDLDLLVEQPLDLLLCELAHVDPVDLFEYLADRPIKHVAFTHVSQKLWQDESGLRELAAERLGGTQFTFVADDQKISF